MTTSTSPVLRELSRRMQHDGIYWLPHEETDYVLRKAGLKAAEREKHMHDLRLSGSLIENGVASDKLTLAGYQASIPESERHFAALLASLRRAEEGSDGPLKEISFQAVCQGSKYFYPDDRDCTPEWIHSLLMLLGICGATNPSGGPWPVLAHELRVAVECETVGQFLEERAAARERRVRHRSELEVRRSLGRTIVTLLHPDVTEQALPRWQPGQFIDAVRACLQVVEDAVARKVGVEKPPNVSDFLFKVFSRADDVVTSKVSAFVPVRLRLPRGSSTEQTQKNRQDALKHLAVGFQKGVRNPVSHEHPDLSEIEALEILCLASHTLRLIDECEVVDLQNAGFAPPIVENDP